MTGMGRVVGGGLASMLILAAWGCRYDAVPPRSALAAPAGGAPVAEPSAPEPEVDVEREEYFVYDDLIRGEYWWDGIELVVLSNRTVVGHGEKGSLEGAVARIREALPGAQAETIADFERKNATPQELRADLFFRPRPSPGGKDRIVLGPEVKLISEGEKNKLFQKGDGWKRFYATYPESQGILDVSRVGFNGDRTQALVYAGNQSHWLAGAGFYVLLEKKDGKWEIAAKDGCWIS